jgi:hypothetical protein
MRKVQVAASGEGGILSVKKKTRGDLWDLVTVPHDAL